MKNDSMVIIIAGCFAKLSVLFGPCPNREPQFGLGYITDLMLLIVKAFPFKAKLELVDISLNMGNVSENEYYPRWHELLIANDIDLVPQSLFDPGGRYCLLEILLQDFIVDFPMDKVSEILLVNGPTKMVQVPVYNIFGSAVWISGFAIYTMALSLLFWLYKRKQRNPLHLAFELSFTQKDRRKWRNKGVTAALFLTLWSLCSKVGLVQFRSQIIKLMSPDLLISSEFNSFTQLIPLLRVGKYRMVFHEELPFCYYDMSQFLGKDEFCKAAIPTEIILRGDVDILSTMARETKGTVLWTYFEFVRIIAKENQNLRIVFPPELPKSFFPVFAFPRIYAMDEESQARKRKLKEYKTLTSKLLFRLLETGIWEKMRKDYDMFQHVSDAKQKPVKQNRLKMQNLRIPFQLFLIAFITSILALGVEIFIRKSYRSYEIS